MYLPQKRGLSRKNSVFIIVCRPSTLHQSWCYKPRRMIAGFQCERRRKEEGLALGADLLWPILVCFSLDLSDHPQRVSIFSRSMAT